MRNYASPRYAVKRKIFRKRELEERVLAILQRGGIHSVEDIAAEVYADREDGGPEWALACIAITICTLRRRGAAISTVRGYTLNREVKDERGKEDRARPEAHPQARQRLSAA